MMQIYNYGQNLQELWLVYSIGRLRILKNINLSGFFYTKDNSYYKLENDLK
jgi:hypothetical protein